MNLEILGILKVLDIQILSIGDLNNKLIEREKLLNNNLYILLKNNISNLRSSYSSSYLTCLHEKAQEKQKWPLLNFLRQILKVYNFNLKPIRKSMGYDKLGKKQFKRFFIIQEIKKTICIDEGSN